MSYCIFTLIRLFFYRFIIIIFMKFKFFSSIIHFTHFHLYKYI